MHTGPYPLFFVQGGGEQKSHFYTFLQIYFSYSNKESAPYPTTIECGTYSITVNDPVASLLLLLTIVLMKTCVVYKHQVKLTHIARII